MRIEDLSKDVNKSARENYRRLCEITGVPFPPLMPSWFALRQQTPYPYHFKERGLMIPQMGTDFGGIIFKDRKSGLDEIHFSIEKEEQEHGWIFIPEVSLWIDHSQGAIEAGVATDQYLTIFLSYLFPVVEMVHTHPDKVLKALYEEGIYDFTANYLIEAARPSIPDMIRHQQLHARNNPTSHLVSSIVSHYGVTTFELNEIGRIFGGSFGRLSEYQIDPFNDPIEETKKLLQDYRYTRTELSLNGPGRPIFDFSFTALS